MKYGNYFAKRILEKGYQYYLDGFVYNVIKEGNVYKGNVKGTEDYQVEIQISNEFKVTQMHCTCPYAQDGKKCKHEAAVLLEIFGEEAVMGDMHNDEDEWDEEDDYDDGDEYDDYDEYYETGIYQEHEILGPLEKKTKSEILDMIALALEDSSTYDCFLRVIDNNQRIENIKNMIIANISSYLEIQPNKYQDIYAAIQKLHDIHLDNQIPSLANESLCRMLDTFSTLEPIQEDSFNHMIELIEKYSSSVDEKTEIYDHLCLQYNQSIIYSFMEQLYKQDYSFEKIIDDLEKKISISYRSTKMFYQKYIYIISHFQPSSFQYIIQKYSQNQEFLFELIKHYINNKQFQEAEKVCIEKMLKIKEKDTYQLLVEIYQETKQKDKLISLYTQLLCRQYPGSIKYYHLLKEMYSLQEWQQKKFEIIHDLEQQTNLCAIYQEEQMYDSLMRYFIEHQDMIEIRKYEDILFQKEKEKIMALYKEFIMESLKKTGSREFYKNIASYINKIAQYDETTAYQIIDNLVQLYPKRHAMIEEIQIKKEVTVHLSDVIQALENTDNDMTWYYHEAKGEFVPVYDDTNMTQIEVMLNSDEYIELPSSYDIHEYHIMEMFIEQLTDQKIRNIMRNAIKGKGAFRRFKDLAHQYHIINQWYQFLNNEYKNIAINWCQKHNLSFVE